MPSFRSLVLKRGIKIVSNRFVKLKGKSVEERRELLNNAAKKWTKLPGDCKVEPFSIGGIYTEWLSNEQSAAEKVILYLHGGGYGYCSVHTHRPLAARIMKEAGVKVLLPEYRLAPEYPFPAAIEDTINIYHWLLRQGYDASNIIFAGDSAGGGLSVAAALFLKETREKLPAAVICLSPWVDLTSSGESYEKNKKYDPYLNIEGVKVTARQYAGGESLEHPLISPVFADFYGFPPLFIQVGSIEILLSDALKLAEKAKKAGVDVSIKVWKGMWHVWQASGTVREAKQAVKEIGDFVKKTFRGA